MLSWPSKDPDEVLDYQLNWADPEDPRLETGETLTSSSWTVAEGDVAIQSDSYVSSGLTTVWLTGGSDGVKCELLNRVVTSAGRTYDETVVLRIRSH